jgi:hypothetical protein
MDTSDPIGRGRRVAALYDRAAEGVLARLERKLHQFGLAQVDVHVME